EGSSEKMEGIFKCNTEKEGEKGIGSNNSRIYRCHTGDTASWLGHPTSPPPLASNGVGCSFRLPLTLKSPPHLPALLHRTDPVKAFFTVTQCPAAPTSTTTLPPSWIFFI
ncbi:hypothetical protein L2E82_38028, partial [Cichorium intybus]